MRASATATLGSAATAVTTEASPASTTRGAASWARSRAVVQSAVKLRATIIEPAMEAIATMGAASAAAVREPARTWSRANRAATSRPTKGRASWAARKGKRIPPKQTSPTTITSGRRIATSRANNGSIRVDTARTATTPAQQRVPTRACPRLTRRRSRMASCSAAIGVTRDARREARQAPTSATPAPEPAATAQEIHGTGGCRSRSVIPRARRNHMTAGVSAVAATQPTTVASTATTVDSPSTSRRTCRGVAPTRRNSPSSRRRVAMTNPKVLATTKTAMNSDTAAMKPNIAARSSSWARSAALTPGRPAVASTEPTSVTVIAISTIPQASATNAPV